MIPLRIHGITHVALELSSPTRMERYLRDVFGLQLLRVGYLRGEYVRVIGSPHHQRDNPGLLRLYNRPFIPRGRLRYLGMAAEHEDVDTSVGALRGRGYYGIDGEDILAAPDGLRLKVDSFARPRTDPIGDPVTKMVAAEVDHELPCLVRGIHHVALDVPRPERLLRSLASAFGFDGVSHHDRRGERIDIPYYVDGRRDVMGRRLSSLALFHRASHPETALNHIAFEMADCEAAIGIIESRGAVVDLEQDAIIHGPEEVWYQIDSRDTPFPVDHPANRTGVTLIHYGRELRRPADKHIEPEGGANRPEATA